MGEKEVCCATHSRESEEFRGFSSVVDSKAAEKLASAQLCQRNLDHLITSLYSPSSKLSIAVLFVEIDLV